MRLNYRRVLTGLGFEHNIVVMGVGTSITTFANTTWLFFLPLILTAQGFSPFEIGVVYALSLLLAAVIQFPVGAFVDSYGRKPAIVVGTLLPAFTIALLAFSTSPVISSLAYILQFAVAGPFFALGRQPLIAESVGKNRIATGFGAYTTMAGWASIFAPTIGGAYIATHLTELLLASSALYLVVTFIMAVFLKETLALKKGVAGLVAKRGKTWLEGLRENFLKVRSNRKLILITIAYAMYGLLFSQISFIIPLYTENVIGLNSYQLGVMYSVFILIDTQLALPFGRLADKWGEFNVIMTSWIGEMAFMMLFAYSVGFVATVAFFSIWVAFGTMDGPAVQSLLSKVSPTETRGQAYGIFGSLKSLVSIPVPIIIGALYTFSPRLPFFLRLAVDLSSFVILAGFGRKLLRSENLETSPGT